jgi:signal transduction histidine kinase/DNA-binding response OmpR family regulator
MTDNRVLLVDDESTIAAVVRGLLVDEGCDVIECGSAEEALAKLEGSGVAVALVDIVLPGMNGLGLLAEIKKKWPDVEVVIMTSHASIESAIEAMHSGAYGYIRKPFEDIEQVWVVVEKALEKRRLALENRELLRDQELRNHRQSEAVMRLSALIVAGRAMGDFRSLQELLDFFIGLVTEQLDVERASIMLVDEEAGDMAIAASRGLAGFDPAEARVRIGDGIAGTVALTGEPIVVADVATEPKAIYKHDPEMGPAFVSAPIALSIPIKSGKKVLGVINATNKRSKAPFDEQDLSYLSSLCGQVAMAIERTRHFEELQRAYDSLKSTQEQLVATERLKALGQMAAGVAHDLNNALAVILGTAQMALRRIPEGLKLDKDLRESLEMIDRVAQQGAEAIRRIQDYTRIRKDTGRTPVDLNAVVADAIEMTRPKWKEEAEAQGRGIRVEFMPGELPEIWATRYELTQVVGNLIFNAVEAMPSGGTLGFRTFAEDDSVVIEVEDTGIGMSEETKARFFEPFYTTKPNGQGLGTSIVYGIVTRHQGKISVTSEEGRGTTVRIAFPVVMKEPVANEPLLPIGASAGKSARILLVEDDDNVRDMLEKAMLAAGHDVSTSNEGEKALSMLKQTRFDLVITDLSLPGMSGFDIARNVKTIDPHVPVVLLSGWAIQQDSSEARNAGIDYVLGKPCTIDALLGLVQNALRGAPGSKSTAPVATVPWDQAGSQA